MKATEINIRRTTAPNYQYVITGIINNEEVRYFTNDSETFDYLNDEDYPEKQEEALSYCETMLNITYNEKL